MSKQATALARQERENLPAENLPTFLDEYREQDAGKGISTSAKDKQVPLLRVLQALSPQTKQTNPLYIQGATEGMILMRGAPNPLIRGEEGFLFQPCYFSKHVVEWIPREQGGGFIGRHMFEQQDSEEIDRVGDRLGARPDSKNKFKYVMPNQHELVETRYHTGHVILGPDTVMPYVLPFAGSGHSVSRQWMQQLDGHRRYAASFGTLWRLKTRLARNPQGEWYILDPQFVGYVDRAPLPFDLDRMGLYQTGKALYESMASGEREIGEEDSGDLGDAGGGGGADRAGI